MAVTACRLVSVDRAPLAQVFARHPDLAVKVCWSTWPARYACSPAHLGQGPSSRRTGGWPATCSPCAPTGTGLCAAPRDIGSSVGVSRVTVRPHLGDFARLGWLRTGYRTLELLDRDALAALAEWNGIK